MGRLVPKVMMCVVAGMLMARAADPVPAATYSGGSPRMAPAAASQGPARWFFR